MTFAIVRYREKPRGRELLLIWGFAIALSRDLFMIIMALLQALGVFNHNKLHEIFPPLEHTLHDIGLILVAGASILYLTGKSRLTRWYLTGEMNEELRASPPQNLRAKPDMAQRLPLKILLAEDNLINQMLCDVLLRRNGYHPDIFNNGRKAVSAASEQNYDVILIDVNMPELDGIEATRAIRRESAGKHEPTIIATTASAMQGD